MADVQWLASYVEDDEVCFRIGRLESELVAEWIGTLTLTVRSDGREPRFDIVPDADPYDVAKIRRGSAQLLLRHLQGKLAMHGAAVAIDGHGVVLLARSGQGKSTLAASLCANAGAMLLADDAVAIDVVSDRSESDNGTKYVIHPLELDHWLDEAARRALGSKDGWAAGPSPWEAGKAPIRAAHPAETSIPVSLFVDLVFDAEDSSGTTARAEMITGVDAMACLVPQVVRFIVDEPEIQRREMRVLADLVPRIPFFRITRPRRFDQLDRTADLVVEVLSKSIRSP